MTRSLQALELGKIQLIYHHKKERLAMSVSYDSSIADVLLLFLIPVPMLLLGFFLTIHTKNKIFVAIAAVISLVVFIATIFPITAAQDEKRADFNQSIEEAYGVSFSDRLLREAFRDRDDKIRTKLNVDDPLQGLYTVDGKKRSAVFYIAEVGENEYSLFVAGATSELIPFEDSEGKELQALGSDAQ